ncbi:MAG TPA: hypothetical protein VFI62_14170, partial [Burkholderiales bacterium]|nr:hypothetical protein [Burkholderiales bacterium]
MTISALIGLNRREKTAHAHAVSAHLTVNVLDLYSFSIEKAGETSGETLVSLRYLPSFGSLALAPSPWLRRC